MLECDGCIPESIDIPGNGCGQDTQNRCPSSQSCGTEHLKTNKIAVMKAEVETGGVEHAGQ